MASPTEGATGLASHLLCEVDITLASDAPVSLGKSPWRSRRISYIAGGAFAGERLKGVVCAGGADWSEVGAGADGAAATLVDVRSSWLTDDGAQLYVAYAGRLIIPRDVLGAFRDPASVESLSPDSYYFRTLVTFETGDARYGWLNELVAVGLGRRTARGVTYRIFAID